MNARQKRFADNYIKTGIAEQSALDAGYSKTYARAQSHKLLANVGVMQYIGKVNKHLDSVKIADMKEVKEYWTNTMRSKSVEDKDRLKASEYLAKTNAAFVDKVEHSGVIGSEVNIVIGSDEYGD